MVIAKEVAKPCAQASCRIFNHWLRWMVFGNTNKAGNKNGNGNIPECPDKLANLIFWIEFDGNVNKNGNSDRSGKT